VNARLQVEHPVTEMISGVDLVEQQLRIASGEPLSLDPKLMSGDRSAMMGHAIEARIIAEDPANGFLPSIGTLLAWAEPSGLGVRVDTGFEAGSEVSRYYDSLLAKLIVHAPNRQSAISRMQRALLDFHVLGVKTNISYALEIASNERFRDGAFDTGFVAKELPDWKPSQEVPSELLEISDQVKVSPTVPSEDSYSGAWSLKDAFRLH
jgi:acetyl/propionyl-CoA carboxylase alpha subunit